MFSIFLMQTVFFFTAQTILLLNCCDNFSGMPVGFFCSILIRTWQVIADNGFNAS